MALQCAHGTHRHSRSRHLRRPAGVHGRRRRRRARRGAPRRARGHEDEERARSRRWPPRSGATRRGSLAANAADVAAAKAAGHDAAFVDRLTLTPATIEAMAEGGSRRSPRCPIPSARSASSSSARPASRSATCACRSASSASSTSRGRTSPPTPPALCLKAGNATILRGGSEALASNQAIAACVHEGLRAAGLPEPAVQVIATTDRDAVGHAHRRREARRRDRAARRQEPDRAHREGGEGAGDQASRRRLPRLRRRGAPTSRWRSASPTTRRRSATRRATRWRRCSSTRASRARVLPPLAAIYAAKGVELRGCERARALVPAMKAATENDWYTEYLAPILAVRDRRRPRRGDRPHREVRLAAHRRDRHQRPRGGDALPARGRLELGDGQRVDALRRRLRVRARRGDRHLDQQAARARTGRPRGPHEPQVDRARLGPDPRIMGTDHAFRRARRPHAENVGNVVCPRLEVSMIVRIRLAVALLVAAAALASRSPRSPRRSSSR